MRWVLTCISLWLYLGAAFAQPVTLTAIDGELALTGDLRQFDGRFYQIDTEFGLVTVAGDRVLCTGEACPGDNQTTGFSLTVDAHLARVLVPALVEAFAAQQGLPSIRRLTGLESLIFDLGRADGSRRFPVSIRIAQSAEAFADLAVGEADMILTTRQPTRAERAIALDAGQGDLDNPAQELLIALDALVAVRGWFGPGEALTVDDLRTGNIGPRLHVRAGSDDARWVLGELAGVLDRVPHQTLEDLRASLRVAPRDLGLVPHSARGNLSPITLAGSCGLDLVADRAHLRRGETPFLIPALAYLPARRLPRDMIPFIAFLGSDLAAQVIARAGFESPSATPEAGAPLADRVLAALAQPNASAPTETYREIALALGDAEILGLGFPLDRDTDRTAQLIYDRSLETLARALLASRLRERVLIVAGFGGTDSEAAARKLHTDLLEATGGITGDATFELYGFGDALPVACSGDPWAKRLNARVEVWLR